MQLCSFQGQGAGIRVFNLLSAGFPTCSDQNGYCRSLFHRSTVAPCPDIASLQISRSDSRSPWLPRNKVVPSWVERYSRTLTSVKINSPIWPHHQSNNKNLKMVSWDLWLRFLLAALLQTWFLKPNMFPHTPNKVVEKDPSKNWFKLPGKPVGKWEIELYRKQTAWDSDSKFHVQKPH